MSFKITVDQDEKRGSKEKEKSPRERIGSFSKDTEKTLQRTSSNSVQSLARKGSGSNLDKFQLSNYDFNFESIFLFQDIYETLYKFLCSELKVKNYRQLDFIMDLQRLDDEIDFNNKYKRANIMIGKYIKRGGEFELYVSPTQKQKVLKDFEELSKKYDEKNEESVPSGAYREVFQPVYQILMIELQRDVAPRFTRSKECRNILKFYMNNLEVLVLKQVKEFPYTDKDFSECLIVEKDYNFMYSLTKDDLSWELIDCVPGELSVYFSEQNLLPDVKLFDKLNVIKYVVTVPHPFEKVCCHIFNSQEMLSYSPNMVAYKELEKMSYDSLIKDHPDAKILKKNYGVFILDIKLAFPVTTLRKYPFVIGMDLNEKKGELSMIWKPCVHKSFASDKFAWAEKTDFINDNNKKETVYFMFDFQSWMIKKIDENKTQLTQIHLGDLGGWAQNATLMRMVVKKRGAGLRESIMKHLDKFKDDDVLQMKDKLEKDPFGQYVVEEFLKK